MTYTTWDESVREFDVFLGNALARVDVLPRTLRRAWDRDTKTNKDLSSRCDLASADLP